MLMNFKNHKHFSCATYTIKFMVMIMCQAIVIMCMYKGLIVYFKYYNQIIHIVGYNTKHHTQHAKDTSKKINHMKARDIKVPNAI